MKIKKYIFLICMSALIVLTFIKYKNILNFISNSEDHTIVIQIEPDKLSELKLQLEKMTLQKVETESSGEVSKLTIKCPPEKLGLIIKKLRSDNYIIKEEN